MSIGTGRSRWPGVSLMVADPGRALIISGSLGKGHDTLAQACTSTLSLHGVTCRTFDAMSLLGSGAGAAGERVFRALLDRPPVYDAFHFNQLRPGGRLARAMNSAAQIRAWPRFEVEAARFQPGLVLAVFATGTGLASRYKAQHPEVVTAVFITDAQAHAMWVDPGIDVYMVISEAAAASVRRYQPAARTVVVTAPVRDGFYTPPVRAQARASLGVPLDQACALLMSGAWGVGPVAEAATALAADGVHVMAVAGINQRLERRLRKLEAGDGRIRAFGYTDRVPELMAAADVVVTSSGDTCREARAVGRTIVLLDAVPGHGRENLLHELELGHAAVASATGRSVAAVVRTALAAGRDPEPVGSLDAWNSELRAALQVAGFAL